MLDITCYLCKEQYLVGESAVLLIKGHANALLDDATILGQIHAHTSADSRWIKTDNKYLDFVKSSAQNQSEVFSIPSNPTTVPHHISYCCFATSRLTLSPSHLFESGVFLEFQIPVGSFPSFKGLSGGTAFYLTVSVQTPNGMKQMHYPFNVNGTTSTDFNSEENTSPQFTTRFVQVCALLL